MIFWMIILKAPLKRRNVNSLTKTYLVGRRYLLEKKEEGNHSGEARVPKLSQNGTVSRTDKQIGDQLGLGRNTVNRASEFTFFQEVQLPKKRDLSR